MLVVAATAAVAAVCYIAWRTPPSGSLLATLSMLSPLRILAAPLFAGGFLLSGLLAPARSSRTALLVAALLEAASFSCVVSIWILSSRSD